MRCIAKIYNPVNNTVQCVNNNTLITSTTPTTANQFTAIQFYDSNVLLEEGQKYGSTYELLKNKLVTLSEVISWLKTRPITINNLITYYHCLLLYYNTNELKEEYSIIYKLYHNHYVNINDPLERVYFLITNKDRPSNKKEAEIQIKCRHNVYNIPVELECYIVNEWWDKVKKEVKEESLYHQYREQRKKYLRSTTKYYGMLMEKYI